MPKVIKQKKSSSSRSSPIPIRSTLEDDIKSTAEPGKLKVKRVRVDGHISKERNSRPKLKRNTNQDGDVMEEKGESKDDYNEDDGDEEEEEEEDRERVVPKKLSAKIMSAAFSQQKEEERGDDEEFEDDEDEKTSHARSRVQSLLAQAEVKEEVDDDDENEEEEINEDEVNEEIELSAEDEASLSMFMPESIIARRNFGDLILSKLEEHKTRQENPPPPPLDPRIVAVYTGVGKFLSHYKSGKIPKAFKVIPSLNNWDDILALTSPDKWSSQSISAATRLFASNLNEKMAQRFFNLIVLPRIQSDLANHTHLNYHLYQALRHSLYKPAAFFRGILLPLANDGLTVREGVIIASILAKYSVPALHAAVTCMKLCELPYSGPTCLVIKTIINKKYSLPHRVLNSLYEYFHAFIEDDRKMPLIWHQTLLVYVQRYKLELTPEQISGIKSLIKLQAHQGISPDIKRELNAVEGEKEGKKSQPSTPFQTSKPRTMSMNSMDLQ